MYLHVACARRNRRREAAGNGSALSRQAAPCGRSSASYLELLSPSINSRSTPPSRTGVTELGLARSRVAGGRTTPACEVRRLASPWRSPGRRDGQGFCLGRQPGICLETGREDGRHLWLSTRGSRQTFMVRRSAVRHQWTRPVSHGATFPRAHSSPIMMCMPRSQSPISVPT